MPGQHFLAKVDFILKIGAAFHKYGTPAHRLEQALALVSEKLSIQSQILSLPTSIVATFRSQEDELTRVMRIAPGEVDLGKLSEMDKLGDDAIAGRISLAECSRRIDRIVERDPIHPPWLTALCHGLSSLGIAGLFQATGRDLFWSFVIGSTIGVLNMFTKKSDRLQRVFEATAAVLASFIVAAAAYFEPRISAPTVLLAGLIGLLPGLTLTIALNELATQNVVAGTTRFMGAIVKLLQLVFGVVLGSTLVALFVKIPEYTGGTQVSEPHVWGGLAVAAFASVVLNKAPFRDAGWIVGASCLGFVATKVGTHFIGPTLGAFVGGFAIGAGSNLFARLFSRPSQLIVVPGLTLIVPGSLGYKSITFFTHNDVVKGVDAGFEMFLIAITIVAGLLFGNVFISPKRIL